MSIFYTPIRVGQNGLPFRQYKFRTMVENADQIGGSTTSDDDPRITRIGYYLRKTKLDELPQLLNVCRGEMALVGWRPEHPEYLDTIPKAVLRTKPGIIGLATLYDMDEGAEVKGKGNPDKYYREVILPRKRFWELKYVNEKSLLLDLKIIALTLWKLLFR